MESGRTALATHWWEVALAGTALVVGSLVYMLDRPPDSAAFFSAISLSQRVPGVFGSVGDSLPTFVHAFSFSILTALCLGPGKRAFFSACATWFAIDCAFEIGQHPQIAGHLVPFIPHWFERLPLLEHADSYFVGGTFDPWDLVSIAAGATAAYFVSALRTPGS